ncbi:hypothetical protein [Clostridium sp. UBA1353]|uniref:hypothetical protein n=1 Tax=Clostridium sp. UBA1353 TaxID=1946347 RepID=UPI001243294C
METKLPLEQLITKVLMELKKLNYSENTITGYSLLYRRIVNFANEKGQVFFSEELGREFLEKKYNCTVNYYKEAFPKGPGW